VVFTPANLIPDGTYTIGNRSNGNIASMATANVGAGIIQGQPGSLDTTWTVTNLGSNVVKITNVGVGRRDRLRLRSHQRRPGRPDRYRRDLAAVDRHSACPRLVHAHQQAGPFVADIYSCLGTQLLLETANGGSTQQWSFH